MKAVINSIKNAILKWLNDNHLTAAERYLAESTDIIDLEMRMREIDRRRFSGGFYR